MATGSSRRALLVAALGFALIDGDTPELRLIHEWLSNWTGIGLIADGMARQDYFDLQLTKYGQQGWRANF